MASLQTKFARVLLRGSGGVNSACTKDIFSERIEEKLSARSMTSKVQRVEVEKNGKSLKVSWRDGHISNFHSMWLRFSCPCDKCRDYVSNMTRNNVEKIPMDMTIKAKVEEQGISVQWEQENHQAIFDPEFLAEHCISEQRMREKRNKLKPSPSVSNTISELKYEEVVSSDKGLYKWLKIINEEGLCLLKGVPTEENYLKKVISLIAPVLKTLYGELYDVKHEEKPINIAYSNEALAFHMDLLQYESPPGIQFLHCIEFDSSVDGGETTFKDLFMVAEEFRMLYPEHFCVLCRVPITFERIHYSRDSPAKMLLRKPMFSMNDYDEIIAINWHANLVGPLEAKEEDIGPFFNAYQHCGRMVAEKKHVKEIRFQPGDLIAYNNRRMVHGRNAFQSKGQGKRHLQGGYVNIDEYKSKLMVLEKKEGSGEPIKRVFNNDWM